MTGTDVLFRFGTDISAIREANEKIVKGVEEAARNSKKSWMEFYATLTMVGHGVRRLAQMFSSAWSQAARFEDAATRLAPLIGGLEQSKSLCEELRDQAANGTQSFEQLASVAGRLASVFKSTDNVRRWTKAFHDISAGTGVVGGRRFSVETRRAKAKSHGHEENFRVSAFDLLDFCACRCESAGFSRHARRALL